MTSLRARRERPEDEVGDDDAGEEGEDCGGPAEVEDVDHEGPDERTGDGGEASDRPVEPVELSDPVGGRELEHERPVGGPGSAECDTGEACCRPEEGARQVEEPHGCGPD